MPALNPIGEPFIELHTVESTNNYAMGLVRAGMAQHGTIVFTHEQTKGKGQRGREWVSASGQNIAMSVIIEPRKIAAVEPFLLSMASALSVHQLLEFQINDEAKIKWPNDIYWRDRKAAGILIENIWQAGEWKFAVIGIGMNVNQTDFAELGTKAVSLKQITGNDTEPVVIAKQLCRILEEKLRLLAADPGEIARQYRLRLYKLNQQVKLKKGNRIFEAEFRDVTTLGQMVVQHTMEERFDVGTVEWIIHT